MDANDALPVWDALMEKSDEYKLRPAGPYRPGHGSH